MKGCLTNLTSTAGQTPDIWDKSKTVSSSIIMAKELQSNLLITALVNLSFMTRGVSDNIFGPTLLDFTSIYSTKVSIISFVVIFRFGGSILGSSIAGIVLDKCLKFRYFILFVYTFIIGLTNVLLPHLPDIWLFFMVMTFSCFASGSLDTGGNVLMLDLNGDSGPYLHSIHFSYALGSFVAPMLAIPFLTSSDNNSQITTLFPILGFTIMIISSGYLVKSIFVLIFQIPLSL